MPNEEQICRSGGPAPLNVFRRYVSDFVNRHDFSVVPEIMRDDYTLDTSGNLICGRDGPYRSAVAKQFEQFPGLQFTVHELFVCGNQIGIRFTEHGSSVPHGGAKAAWPSIAIYECRDGLLARCTIEQDYYSRHRQLTSGTPITIDPPTVAPWDEPESDSNTEAEAIVQKWLCNGDWLNGTTVQVDDSRTTRVIERIVENAEVTITKFVAGGAKAAFHAQQTGALAPDFSSVTGVDAGRSIVIHLSGLVTIQDGKVTAGNIIRDRWGLFRRLRKQVAAGKT